VERVLNQPGRESIKPTWLREYQTNLVERVLNQPGGESIKPTWWRED